MKWLTFFFLFASIPLGLAGCTQSSKPPHFASAHKVGGGDNAQTGFAGAGDADGPSGGVAKN
jgi:hypothetical protein